MINEFKLFLIELISNLSLASSVVEFIISLFSLIGIFIVMIIVLFIIIMMIAAFLDI